MKKIILILFLGFLTIESLGQTAPTINAPSLILADVDFTVSGSGFVPHDCNCGSDEYSLYRFIVEVANTTSNEIITSTSSVAASAENNVPLNVNLSCVDIPSDHLVKIRVIREQQCFGMLGGMYYTECGTYTKYTNWVTIPVEYNNTTLSPTSLYEVTGQVCSNITPINIQYQTNNSFDTYHWYKNGNEYSTTSVNISPSVSVSEGDIIGLVGENECENLSEIFTIDADVYVQPTLEINVEEDSICVEDTFHITATGTNQNTISWYHNFDLSNPVNSSWVSDNGEQLDIPGNYSNNFTIYGIAEGNGDCNSDIQSLALTTKPVPNISNVDGENTMFCTNTANFTINSTNLDQAFWYLESGENTLLATTSANANIDISNYVNGDHTLYLRVLSSDGCSSSIYNVNFTKGDTNDGLSPPTITNTSNLNICESDPTDITLSGYPAYEWYFPDVNGEQSNDIIPLTYFTDTTKKNFLFNLDVGDYTYYYKGITADGCFSQVGEVEFSVLSEVGDVSLEITTQTNINPRTNFCIGETIILTAESNNATNFELYINNLYIGNENATTVGLTQQAQFIYYTDNLLDVDYIVKIIAKNNSTETGTCDTKEIIKTITMNQVPNISISGETTKCLNEEFEFQLSGSSNIDNYLWFSDEFGTPVSSEFIIFNLGKNIKFTPNTPGTYDLYYRGETTSGCQSEMQHIEYVVNETPYLTSVSIDDDVICLGESIEIEAVGGGLTNFEWFKDDIPSVLLEDDNISISGPLNNRVSTTPTEAGVYHYWVRGENSNGCNSELTEISFEVLEEPIISEISINESTDSTQLLFGDSIELSWTSENQSGYRVLHDDVQIFPTTVGDYEISTDTSYLVTSNASSTDNGLYTIELINEECTISEEIELYVFDVELEIFNTVPENEVTEVDDFGNSNTFIDLEQNANIGLYTNLENSIYKHEWHYGDGHMNEGKEVIHFYNEEGNYNVSLIVTNINTGDFIELEYDKIIRVNEFEGNAIIDDLNPPTDDSFYFYPNPVQQELHLNLNISSTQPVVLRIYNMSGLVLFVEEFTAIQGTHVYIWNNPLYSEKGQGAVYIAEISYGDTLKKYKLIKN